MTAPDDFEAWMAREIAENGGVEFGADYRHWAEKGYRAAHADLTAKVRELVEKWNARLPNKADLYNDREGAAEAGVLEKCIDELDAALAKFHPTQRATNYVSGYVDDAGKFHPTHQEKP